MEKLKLLMENENIYKCPKCSHPMGSSRNKEFYSEYYDYDGNKCDCTITVYVFNCGKCGEIILTEYNSPY